jgi:hypothetical protein
VGQPASGFNRRVLNLCKGFHRRPRRWSAIAVNVTSGALGLAAGLLLEAWQTAFPTRAVRRSGRSARRKMKNLLLVAVVCVCGSAMCVAQHTVGGSALSAQPVVFSIPDHPEHASYTGMAHEQNLFEHAGSNSARGEMPLWEAMPEAAVTPLGDSARALRKEHARAKKAVIFWRN